MELARVWCPTCRKYQGMREARDGGLLCPGHRVDRISRKYPIVIFTPHQEIDFVDYAVRLAEEAMRRRERGEDLEVEDAAPCLTSTP